MAVPGLVPTVAVMVTGVLAATAVVVAVKVAEKFPAVIVTVPGTVTAALPELSVTVVPPVGAAVEVVTVPEEEVPPMTVVGFNATVTVLLASTVSVAVELAPLSVAVIVCVLLCATPGAVVTVKVPLVAPAAIVTVAGGVATPMFEDDMVIGRPPVGAALERVMVPVELVPPLTVVGLSVNVAMVGAVTVRVAFDGVPPLTVAPMTLVPFVDWAIDVTVKVALVAPARIVTVAGTVATVVVPDESVTLKPPAGAGLEMATVPVDGVPPGTDVGFSDRPLTVGAVTVRVVCCGVPVPRVAVIVAVAFVATAVVVIGKVAVGWPAVTETDPGTVAEPAFDDRVTVSPPAGAGPLSVTVPVEAVPPTTEVGFTATVVSVGASTVKVALAVLAPTVAVMIAGVFVPTAVVVALKVAAKFPAVTVTEAGTVTAALPELSITTVPPVGAAVPIVAVPVEEVPPITVVGFNVSVTVIVASIVRVAVELAPLSAAVIVWVLVCEVPGAVVTVKVPVVAPAAIVTVAGGVASPMLEDDRAIDRPPVGAALERVMVPVELLPAFTVVGFRVNDAMVGALIVSVALAFPPLAAAPMLLVVFAPTATVVTVNV